MTPYYVAVHGGAGIHSMSSDTDVKRALRRACTGALTTLEHDQGALSGVESAIIFLENDPCLNAGFGSNLTLEGTVECDASIMDGASGDFGSVGALSGAHEFAVSANVETVPPVSLITKNANYEWKRWKALLESRTPVPNSLHDIQDTVGAVCWGKNGEIAAGVSSGGILLKWPGRVGEAAVYGAGCWANGLMGCSISGAGEQIVRCNLARSLANALQGDIDDTHETIQRVLIKEFWDPCQQRGDVEAHAGVLIVTKEEGEDGHSKPRLWCAFTTTSMAVAYASSNNPKPKASPSSSLLAENPEPSFSRV